MAQVIFPLQHWVSFLWHQGALPSRSCLRDPDGAFGVHNIRPDPAAREVTRGALTGAGAGARPPCCSGSTWGEQLIPTRPSDARGILQIPAPSPSPCHPQPSHQLAARLSASLTSRSSQPLTSLKGSDFLLPPSQGNLREKQHGAGNECRFSPGQCGDLPGSYLHGLPLPQLTAAQPAHTALAPRHGVGGAAASRPLSGATS